MDGQTRTLRRGDLLFSSLYSSAVGAAAIALLFLLLDAASGSPLATPSYMGALVFLGAEAAASAGIRSDLTALFSLLHFTAFATIGTAFTFLLDRRPGLARRPIALSALVFAALWAGLAIADIAWLHGVVAQIGIVALSAGNLVAAASMALFFRWASEQTAIDIGRLRPSPLGSPAR